MSDTALLVIDGQESFRHAPYWSEVDLDAYLERQQALIDGATMRGIPVDYVTKATLTFAVIHPNGQIVSPADIKARTELVLAGRFARIATVEGALAGRPMAAAA
ncbi:hypothetical protein NS365_01405 [Aureimonas ureilytica]|uniref:Hydrolase n=1 Tax=Aureimonas ureilytica TaxID=401562 RepID=A0A175RXS1_9HYPH|nr:hypothetical protein [Aureimonas ureilytica]KTR08251.1 hypothetical protein NS365_01405 [Aureimonas ureilytica]